MNSLIRPITSYRGKHNEVIARLVARCLVLVLLWPSVFLPAIAASCATRTLGDGSVQTLAAQVAYDAENRPYLSTAPDGVQSRTFYNSVGQVQRSVRAFGTRNDRATEYVYDVLGQRIQTILPDGGTSSTIYDDAGQVLASFDRVGRGGLSEYDSLGRVVKSYQLRPPVSDSEPLRARIISDGAGNPLYSQTQYDDLGRAVASRDTQGRWSYTTYDDASNVLSSKDPLSHVSSSVYDELNRAYQSTDAKGHTTISSFDNAGRLKGTLFADGSTTSTTYDELNRAVGVTDQLGKTKTMHYDALGRMDYIEMPVASGQLLRTRFGFNELGQKTWQQDARGVQDDAAAGLNVSADAPQSRVTRFGYDVRGRLIQRIMPGQFNGNALAEAMQYDELGQLTRKRDFRGDWTSYQYDDRGRLLLKSPDAALNEAPVAFSYPDEFTTIAQRGLAKTTTHQDPARGWMTGLETQAPSPSGTGTTLSTMGFSHDAYGRTLGQTLQSGSGLNLSSRTTSFGYDGLDRLQSITSDDNQTWNYSYDEVGNKQSLTRPNGTQTGYAYDQLNRLTAMATRKGTPAQFDAGTAPLVSRFDYHLRADGRRDGLSEQVVQPDGTTSSRTVAYAFDLANRLTGESGTDGQGKSYQKSYTLDAAGNRLASSYTLDGQLQAQTAYAYNSLDWLTGTSVQSGSGTSTTSYGYDQNGAQISQTTESGTQAQVWDFEGHLQAQGQVDASGNWSGARTAYAYDAGGMRLSQSHFGATGTLTGATSYVWNGDRVAEERDENGVLQAVYEHGQELGPLRLRRLKDGGWQNRLFIGDGQDSTRQLMNEAGVVTDSYFYDAFGSALNGGQGVTNNSFKYTGQQQDSSGLYYLRARYYNSGTGRFLSQDPEMGSGSDPISMHRYLYAGADAVNGCDPSGRETLLEVTFAVCNDIYRAGNGAGALLNAGAAGHEAAESQKYAHIGWFSDAITHAVAAGSFIVNAVFCADQAFEGLPGIINSGGGGGASGGASAAVAVISRMSAQEIIMTMGRVAGNNGLSVIFTALAYEEMMFADTSGGSGGASGGGGSNWSAQSDPELESAMAARESQSAPPSASFGDKQSVAGSHLQARLGRILKDLGILKEFDHGYWGCGKSGKWGDIDSGTDKCVIEATVSPGTKFGQLEKYMDTGNTLNPVGDRKVILYGPKFTGKVPDGVEVIRDEPTFIARMKILHDLP